MEKRQIKVSRTAEKINTTQWFNFIPDSYLERTSRPVYAIALLLPLIIFYELGTIFINTDVLAQSQIRVVAFVWLQDSLRHIGLIGKWSWIAPPLAVVIILLGLQIASRKSWMVFFSDFYVMVVECIILAIPLLVFSLLINSALQTPAPDSQYAMANFSTTLLQVFAGTGSNNLLADIVTGIGAGIYEELIFRLILICSLMIILQDVLRLEHTISIVLAIIISATLFSVHHHIVFLNGQFGQMSPFSLPEFIFRTLAGIYFAILFAVRGFGVTAGTHAFYDIMATLINAAFFANH